MKLQLLEAFMAVAAHGKISRAAEQLHLSQSSLSRQMAALEQSVGVTLFERHARGIRLTRSGEALQEDARVILARVQALGDELRSGEHRTSIVRLGVPPGIPAAWLREQLMGTVTPGVSISLIEAPTDQQIALLKSGELDIGLLRRLVEFLPSTLVYRQQLGLVVRKKSGLDTRLKNREAAQLGDLEGLRVMAHSRGEIRTQEEVLKNAAHSAGIQINWIFRTFGRLSELIADLGDADAALTTKASAELNFPSWRWIPLIGHEASGRDLRARCWLTWNPQPSPEVSAVIALFDQAARHAQTG